jgi:DNA primase
MIARETIERIKQQANLVELVSQVVALKRQGRNLLGLCPFHSEKSPSFNVKDSGDYYRCFGCGASGNAISFIMESRGLSFVEAVEELAARYGIEVIYTNATKVQAPTTNREELYTVYKVATEYFQRELKRAPAPVQQYIKDRHLTPESLKQFQIGFAPVSWQGLTDYLRSQKISDDLMLRAGVIIRSNEGKIYDRFRGRLMFPIIGDGRHVIAFGGRIIPALLPAGKDTPAKYLNSPESEIYRKSKIFYGLPQAIQGIRAEGFLYLVEGYLDLIALHQVGVTNVLATCGTAVTPDHIQRLGHLTKRVVVLFDGDEAGLQAAAKLFPLTINTGIDFFVTFLPEGEDPDDLAHRAGQETAKVLASTSQKVLFESYLDQLVARYAGGGELGPAAKGELADEVVKLLNQVSNPIERGGFIEILAAKLQLQSAQVVERMVSTGKDGGRAPVADLLLGIEDSSAENQVTPIDKLSRFDRELLRCTITNRGLIQEVLASPSLCGTLDSETIAFLIALQEIDKIDESVEQKRDLTKQLLSMRGKGWVQFWRESYRMAEDPSVNMKKAFEELCKQVSRKLAEREVDQLVRGEFKGAHSDEEKLFHAQRVVELKRSLK